MNQNLATLLLASLLCLAGSNICRAAVIEFTVDPALSYLTISPSVTTGSLSFPTSPQGPGSFTASYSGTISAEITGSTIQLLPGTSLVAGISGSWIPGTDFSNYPADNLDPNGYAQTSQPANYGILTDYSSTPGVGPDGTSPSAIRDLTISLMDPAPRPIVGGVFDEAGTMTELTAGTVYYGAGGSPPITDLTLPEIFVSHGPTLDLPGGATLTVAGGVQTLTLPVSFVVSYPVSFLTLTTVYTGSIVATAPIPEPASAMLALAAGGLVVVQRWRRTRAVDN